MADATAVTAPTGGGNSAILLAQSRLLSRRCHSRVESLLTWRTSLASALRTPGWVDAHATELAKLVVSTLWVYYEPPLQRAVCTFVEEALDSPAFVKAFAGEVARVPPAGLPPAQSLVLVRWSAAVLARLELPGAAKAVDVLMKAQVQLLATLQASRWKPHVWLAAPKATFDQPELLQRHLGTACSKDTKGTTGLAAALVHHCACRRPLLDANRGALLTGFCEKVIMSRDVMPTSDIVAWAPLLRALTQDEVVTTLVPKLLLALKRTPDAALSVAPTTLGLLLVDLSPAATELLTALVPQLRHVKPENRAAAASVVGAAAGRLRDAAGVEAACQVLQEALDGKSVKAVPERVGLYTGLAALAPAPGAGEAQCLSTAGFLVRLASGEATEEGQLGALSALGGWMRGLGRLSASSAAPLDAICTALVTILRGGKERSRSAALRAIVELVSGRQQWALQAARPMLPALAAILAEGIAKAATRADAVSALMVLVLAGPSSAPPNDADLASAWAALGPDSVLLSASTSCKLPPGQAVAQAQMAACVLGAHTGQLGDPVGSTTALARCLVLLSLHYSREVRDSALQGIAWVVSQDAVLAISLASAISFWLKQSEAPSLLEPPGAGEDVGVTPASIAKRYRAALLAALPASMPPGAPEEFGARVMLLAHHPRLTCQPLGARGPVDRRVWNHSVTKLPAIEAAVGQYGKMLLAEVDSSDTDSGEYAAALRALSSAVDDTEGTFIDTVLPGFAEWLDRTEHDSLSEEKVAAFRASDGILSSEMRTAAERVPDIDDVALRAGGKKDAEDTVPVPSLKVAVRPASAAGRGSAGGRSGGRGGRGAPGKKDPAQELRERQLAEEAAIRADLTRMQKHLAKGLDAIAATAGANAHATLPRLEALAPLVVPLLGSRLVGDNAALRAAVALAGCLPGVLGRRAPDLAAALRVVKSAEHERRADDLSTQPTVAASIAAMVGVTVGPRRAALTPPAYALCFPLLRAVLALPMYTALHEDAVAVLGMHVAPGMPLPRAESLQLLFNVLAVVPAYRERVLPMLRSLCAGLPAEQLTSALQGLLAGGTHVRAAALDALSLVPCIGEGCLPTDSDDAVAILWLACHDPVEANAAAATALWTACAAHLPPGGVASQLITHLGSAYHEIRVAAADALCAATAERPGTSGEVLQLLVDTYASHPQQAVREGIALALGKCSSLLTPAEVPLAVDFLLGSGLADDAQAVRDCMVKAGTLLVDAHGAQHAQTMMPLFEGYLGPNTGTLSEESYDRVREGAVVFLGTLARHLPKEDPKIRSVLASLLEALTIPSESVQRAVSACLIPLMPSVSADKEYVDALIKRLLEMLTRAERYGDRRGAAFGIAGVVKGLGIASLKAYLIMDALKAAVENKREALAREGSLFAFEALSERLGRLFEPYVIHILPMLLVCFGDTQPAVREATEGAARAIMGQLSGQGVKLVLPSLLNGLDDDKWRTKQGSTQLLGSMAYCAPKQLSTCLPTIVPRLGDVLGDPHPKVQSSAREALQEVGSVIRNPEVQRLVPNLLAALAEPNKHTKTCLEVVLKTVFVNTIDAPSLALILPVVQRGLRDRSGDTKKRAARIVGNMCQLINDAKDMEPYVPLLMPELQKALVDPLPEVRATAAKAMGSLLHGMGEAQFRDLVPWLLEMLRSEGSTVERSGAAQGLSEVLAVLGVGQLEALLPDIIKGTYAKHAFTREGHQTLFRYLPIRMEAAFQAHLAEVLPAILHGLSDQEEGVRDAALAAGHRIVEVYAVSNLPMLLPVVEEGIFSENWRIRQSSVELLGDLLFKVAGTSGKVVVDGGSDDEGISTEAHGAAIVEALGMDRRNEVLARVYMARSDVSFAVRSGAVHVWKTVVTNTPRTLTEIMASLMQQAIESLADSGEERQQMAGRCIGELVRKMGERVLHNVVPILTGGISEAADVATRRGVCYGLREVLENITKQQLTEHLDQILPALQAALCDEDALVREAAGEAFGILFRGGGGGMLDTVVPGLLAGLDVPASVEKSLQGLRVILTVRPQTFGHILPKLMAKPVSAPRLHAVGDLGAVASASLQPHLQGLAAQLMIIASGESEAAAAGRAALHKLAPAVSEDAVYILVGEIVKALDNGKGRRGAAELAGHWASSPQCDLSEHTSSLLTATLENLSDADEEFAGLCWTAAKAVASAIPKEVAPSYVRCVKDAVGTARERQLRKRNGIRTVAGLCLPKALAPLLPIYLQGVLQGSSAELRELAAEGLGELVECTDEGTLRPFVVQITGPLIRIIGDRFPWQIKAAILNTMGLLIRKAGTGLKPFVPQMQTTFMKCLNDSAQQVRHSAACNMGVLSKMSVRVDQLAADLTQSVSSTSDPQVRYAFLEALQQLLHHSASRLSLATVSSVGAGLEAFLQPTPINFEDRSLLADCIGEWARVAPDEDLKRTLSAALTLGGATKGDVNARHMAARTLQAICAVAYGRVKELEVVPKLVQGINKCATDSDISIKLAAARATGRLLVAEMKASDGEAAPSLGPLCPVLVALTGPDQRSEVQRAAMAALRAASRYGPVAMQPQLPELIPSLCSLVGAVQGPLKLTAERTLAATLQLGEDDHVAVDLISSGQVKGLAKTLLNDAYLRRISKMGTQREEDEDREDRYDEEEGI